MSENKITPEMNVDKINECMLTFFFLFGDCLKITNKLDKNKKNERVKKKLTKKLNKKLSNAYKIVLGTYKELLLNLHHSEKDTLTRGMIAIKQIESSIVKDIDNYKLDLKEYKDKAEKLAMDYYSKLHIS